MTEQNYRIRIKLGEREIEAEGDKEFVEKYIEEFKKEISKIPTELPSTEKIITPEIQKEKIELDRLSLAEFYKRKNPKHHNETVVVFAYWLKKREKKEKFTAKDINDCYEEAKISKPRNVTQHIQVVASGKKAYLTRGPGRGYYKLTLTGEEFVEKELPKKVDE